MMPSVLITCLVLTPGLGAATENSQQLLKNSKMLLSCLNIDVIDPPVAPLRPSLTLGPRPDPGPLRQSRLRLLAKALK